jgi:hypothetical protein
MSLNAGLIDATVTRHGTLLRRPTGGERHLLEIARAVHDARMDGHELGVLHYNETLLDFDARKQVVAFLTGLANPVSSRLGDIKTLIVLIHSAGISISTHCAHPGGVRFSLEADRLISRHRADDVTLRARRLAQPRTRPPVFFLAAGFSASSDMPVGDTIRDATIRRVTRVDTSRSLSSLELAGAFWDWAFPQDDLLRADERADGRDRFVTGLALEQVVRIESRFTSDPEPQTLRELKALHDRRLTSGEPFGSAIYEMQRIVEHGRPLVLSTVNYDELLEFVSEDFLDIAVTSDDFERLTPILTKMLKGEPHPDGKVPYLKLHGTMTDLTSCVATDTVTRSGLSPAARDALMALIRVPEGSQRLYWTYVGASMRDHDLERNVLAQPEFNRGSIQETWVSPFPDASTQGFLDRNPRDLVPSLFTSSATETADVFVRAFAEAWTAH